MADIKYTEHFVGYIDILGFSDLIKRSEQERDLLNKLANAFSRIEEMWHKKYDASGLIVTSFSDNVILSADGTLQGFLHIAASIDWLTNELLPLGIFIRGAMDYGLLYHDEKIVLGPVLGVVYGIEQSLAIYPRIVCSRAFLKQIGSIAKKSPQSKQHVDEFHRSALARDKHDGVIYLHVLLGIEREIHALKKLKLPESDKFNIQKLNTTISQIVSFLQNGYDEHIEHPSIYKKYMWFSSYWNERVGRLVHDNDTTGLVRLTKGQLTNGLSIDYEYPYIGHYIDEVLGSEIDEIDK